MSPFFSILSKNVPILSPHSLISRAKNGPILSISRHDAGDQYFGLDRFGCVVDQR
jgi:hypothetical protein